MAAKDTTTPESDATIDTPPSTDAVPFDPSPVVTEQPVDNTSTGAIKTTDEGTTTVAYYDAEVVVNYETPGPVTVTAPWFAETKVVGAAAPKHVADPAVEAETK